jgi:two-component SAPR family response regulator
LALENDCMTDFVVRMLEKTESEQAKDLVNWLHIKNGLYDLECRLFGKLDIRDANGLEIMPSWRTKITRELFVLFVAGHRKRYTKDHMIDTFWPHKNLRGAAHSLHVEISALRNTLKEMLQTEIERQRLVLFENQQYFLNPKVYISTDIQEFERLVSQAAAAMKQDRPKARQLYNKALDLYRGDFVEDITAQWCEEIRAYYRKMALDILKNLGQICYEDKAYAESQRFLDRALKLDSIDEAIHVAIMRCLQAIGDKDGIQRQYKKLVKTLDDLGVSVPSREATEIYQSSLR